MMMRVHARLRACVHVCVCLYVSARKEAEYAARAIIQRKMKN